MSSDDHENQGGSPGGWEPIPQSEGYDGDATAFVQLPPDFMLDGVPLEAPGHGYVPPMITPLQPLTPMPTADPAATGTWTVHPPAQAEQTTQYFDGNEYAERPEPYGRTEYEQPQEFGRAGYVEQPQEFERTEYVEQPQELGQTPYFGQAVQTGQAGQAGHFGQGGRAEQAGRPGHFGQAGHAGQGEQAGHGQHPGQEERAGHVEHPGQGERAGYVEHFAYAEQDPHGTAEWRFTETAPSAGPGGTGQWAIPDAPGAPDTAGGSGAAEAVPGEFATSAVRPYAEAPATLPGGAPAPWALPEEPVTQAEGRPADADAAERGAGPAAEPAATETEAAADAPSEVPTEPTDDETGAPDARATAPVPAPAAEPDSTPATTPVPGSDPARESPPTPGSDPAPVAIPAQVSASSVPATPDVTLSASVHASTDSDEHPHTSYTLRVNGADRPVTGSWIGESLLYVLRERLGLAGAKDGCSQGECGACNVQVDGRLVASCLVPAATAAGSEVRTVEGLAVDGEPSDVQRAMSKCGTVQCGFCIPGMCMTVHDLLEGNHAPTELETRQALAGNLCRCSGYRGVLEAVRDVVDEREATAAATAAESADEPRVPHQIPHPHDGGMA
ncbi:2Fe-2S iron-sulfur cluster-binding protein [Streptomyces sp. NPDC058667]|uniref:2Fe-2S iron-sulfur cluster-binding protein n=1 Tax=Streptomyces sp. NPDC058667 TaxID=3346588 RepID=UPI0036518CE3